MDPAPASCNRAVPHEKRCFHCSLLNALNRAGGRRQAVTRLILRGHGNLSIAGNPGITEGTVKLHRQAG